MIRYALIIAGMFLWMILNVNASEKPLIVGLLKPDRVIVPFALFENGNWVSPWSKPEAHNLSDSGSISDLPYPWFKHYLGSTSTWYLWGDGYKGLKLASKRIVQTETHCGNVWGLFAEDALAFKSQPFSNAKIGAVFSRNVAASFFKKILPSSELQPLIKPLFETQESTAISALQSNPLSIQQFFPKTFEERRTSSINIKTVYSATVPGTQGKIEFVIAEKYYDLPKGHNGTCKLISYWEGWVLSAKSTGVIDSAIALTDGDYTALRTEPFALFVVKGRRFIIVQESYPETETYTIYSLNGKLRREISIFGGGC